MGSPVVHDVEDVTDVEQPRQAYVIIEVMIMSRMTFYDRAAELEALHDALGSPGHAFVVLYGRRRPSASGSFERLRLS